MPNDPGGFFMRGIHGGRRITTGTLTFATSLAAAVVPTAGLRAQEGPAAADGARDLPTLTPGDYGRWERLGSAELSANGAWLVAPISRVNEEDELRIRRVADTDSVIVVPYGSSAAFSADGRWLAYSIGLGEEAREKLEEQKKPVRAKLGLVDLGSGESSEVEEVASFSFSPDGRFLAMRRYAPGGERKATGGDLILRDLEDGRDLAFGNVSEHAWQDMEDEDPRLAMVIDAEGMAGNGIQMYEPRSGRLRTLDAGKARYTGLSWREDAPDLAAYRTVPRDDEGEAAWSDTARVALAFRGLGRSDAPADVLDPRTAAGFPAAHRIVPWEDLRWSEDGAMLFLGIQERTPEEPCPEDDEDPEAADDDEEDGDGGDGDGAERSAPGADAASGEGDEEDDCAASEEDEDDDEKTSVEIWHAGDVDIVPTQKVSAERDRRDSWMSVWHVADGRLVQIEDDLTEDARLTDGVPVAVGLDETPYDRDRMFGPNVRDVYLIDLATGERRKALERVQYFTGMSPGGRYLVWLADDHYWSYDTATGERVCLTDGLGTSFVDLEDDHTVDQKPPHGTGGWLAGDAAILLHDEHDIWRVAPDGSGGERVTWGADDNVQHRRVRLDLDEDAIDPEAPQFFSLYDDWGERFGIGRAPRLGGEIERLVWDEARFGGLQKAEDAEVYAVVRSSFEDSPDVFAASDPALRGWRRITRTNPFQSEYAWGRAELIEFDNAWGERLQGSLYYPANYEPGRRYPMIVYIYEIRSYQVRAYQIPSERSYYNFQRWVQDGYFVFQPDIVYRDRDPGVSAVASLEPAVAAVVETGMVDPDRIGLIGHSWGGYQTTFAVTQTDIFAAAVAGAPLTNLFSMYLSVYWNSGGTDARIFEISQGRMEVPFWQDEDAYRRNSPVFHIENMNTPLLMAQGTEDGAVDFNQGVEFYNAARRAGKDFVFLVYNDENHGFSKKANQLDYHRRIVEWFGHYLKGEPAPAWITQGVPYLEQPGGEKADNGGR